MPGEAQIHGYLWVPGALPSTNEILDAKGNVLNRRRCKVRSAYTLLKQQATARVAWAAKEQLRGATWPACCYSVLCVTPDSRKDPDNVALGALKMVLDGIVRAGVIANDGCKQVRGGAWFTLPNPWHIGVFLVAADLVLQREQIEPLWMEKIMAHEIVCRGKKR